MKKYTSLINYSDYSVSEEHLSVEDLVKNAKELGMDSLALTDKGNMCGVIKFIIECQKQNIKPIIGCEFNIKEPINDMKYQVILLCKNEIGYKNLCNLNRLAVRDNTYTFAEVSEENIYKYSDGLICICNLLSTEQNEKNLCEKNVNAIIQKYYSIFKEEIYFAIKKQTFLFGKQTVAISDELCSEQEMRLKFGKNQESVDNTFEIASKCNFKFDFDKKHLPQFAMHTNGTADEYLRTLCVNGIFTRYKKNTVKIKKRLNYELNLIKLYKSADKFLIAADIVEFTKTATIFSLRSDRAAESLVCYLLGITRIDPLKYDFDKAYLISFFENSARSFRFDVSKQGATAIRIYLKRKYGISICLSAFFDKTKYNKIHPVSVQQVSYFFVGNYIEDVPFYAYNFVNNSDSVSFHNLMVSQYCYTDMHCCLSVTGKVFCIRGIFVLTVEKIFKLF